MISIQEYSYNGSFSINYYMELLEEINNEFGEIIVGRNDKFGTLLFMDKEIQITSLDYTKYHEDMVILAGGHEAMYAVENILIIGDGDGGFTHYPWCKNADYVDRDEDIMKIATKYFGANWSVPRKINSIDINNFEPIVKYDRIFLAITDDFNRVSFIDTFNKFNSWLSPKGVLVSQVGCTIDFSYEKVLKQYQSLDIIFNTFFCTSYYPGFFSDQTFFRGCKV